MGGFCQQYDVVFLQACESFGFVGRDISIDSGTLGRPTVDGPRADGDLVEPIPQVDLDRWNGRLLRRGQLPPASPLSLWEVRQRQLRVLRGQQVEPTRIVHIVDSVHQWRGLDVDMSFAELRLIPRSNFLEQKWPLPLNNGKGVGPGTDSTSGPMRTCPPN